MVLQVLGLRCQKHMGTRKCKIWSCLFFLIRFNENFENLFTQTQLQLESFPNSEKRAWFIKYNTTSLTLTRGHPCTEAVRSCARGQRCSSLRNTSGFTTGVGLARYRDWMFYKATVLVPYWTPALTRQGHLTRTAIGTYCSLFVATLPQLGLRPQIFSPFQLNYSLVHKKC